MTILTYNQALVIPAAYHNVKTDTITAFTDHQKGLLIISRGTAILLLVVYIAYLYFQVICPVVLNLASDRVQLKSHAFLFKDEGEREPEAPKMNVAAASIS